MYCSHCLLQIHYNASPSGRTITEFCLCISCLQALFRALKTKHETPKYGLIYHASLIGQAPPKFKGKIARVLAAKSALSTRVDALGDDADASIGIESRAKVRRCCKHVALGFAWQTVCMSPLPFLKGLTQLTTLFSCMGRWKQGYGSLKVEHWERSVGQPRARLKSSRMIRTGKRTPQGFSLLQR